MTYSVTKQLISWGYPAVKGFPKAAVGKDNANKQLEVNLKDFHVETPTCLFKLSELTASLREPGHSCSQGPVSIRPFPLCSACFLWLCRSGPIEHPSGLRLRRTQGFCARHEAVRQALRNPCSHAMTAPQPRRPVR